MQCFWVVYHRISLESLVHVFSWCTHKPLDECVNQENTLYKWQVEFIFHGIPWESIAQLFLILIYVPCHRKYSGQHKQCKIYKCTWHEMGRYSCMGVIPLNIQLLSCIVFGCMYFLWHGTKSSKLCKCTCKNWSNDTYLSSKSWIIQMHDFHCNWLLIRMESILCEKKIIFS